MIHAVGNIILKVLAAQVIMGGPIVVAVDLSVADLSIADLSVADLSVADLNVVLIVVVVEAGRGADNQCSPVRAKCPAFAYLYIICKS